MPRVAYITQWFAPEPTIVPDAIAVALRNAGAEVEVLTGVPNYPTGEVHAGYNASVASRDTVRGFRVRRTPLYPSHDQSAPRRIANYVSWAISSVVWGLGVVWRAQLSVVYGSPITAAAPALVGRLLFRRRYVLIVQDVWPDSVFATGFLTRGLAHRFAFAGLNAFTKVVYRKASKVVVISPGMKSILMERGVDPGKIEIIFNWLPEVAASAAAADSSHLRSTLGIPRDAFVLMYAGNHGPAQALAHVIEAVGSLGLGPPCHLVMIGEGVEKPALFRIAEECAPGRVHFFDQQPNAAMPSLMREADAQLVSLANAPLFAVTVPSKLQSILASGHPVVAVAGGDVARLVTESGAGVAAPPGDSAAIARALRAMMVTTEEGRRSMGRAGSQLYEARMSESVGTTKWAAVLEEMVNTNG